MKTMMTVAIIALLLLAACGTKQPLAGDNEIDQKGAQIANPASTNCVEKGGTVEIRDSPEGQYGVCVFPNGLECEEWALFRGEPCDATQ